MATIKSTSENTKNSGFNISDFETHDNSIIKKLPQKFIGRGEVKGHLFTQLGKTDRAFLYEVNTGSGIYYEVFKKKINHRFGKVAYPSSKGFGIYAWFYSDLVKARRKFEELNSKV